MNIFSKLTEKSWLPHPAGSEFSVYENNENQQVGEVALRFFIAIVSVIFLLITITFLGRSQLADFQALAGEPWRPFTDPQQLWLNTIALVISSAAMQWASYSCRQKKMNQMATGIFIAALFALLFLFGQLLVWQQLYRLGYYIQSNPANSYYYFYTALHGLHLIGGLVALMVVISNSMKKNASLNLQKSLKLCTTYWHFLLLVWVLLFGLLTSTPETFRAIAQLCGY